MQAILNWLLVHGLDVLMWVLTFVGGLIGKYVTSLLKKGKAQQILSRAIAEISDAVLMVGQTYVNALKAAAADGTLTDEEKAKAKQMAIDAAKKNIGPLGLKRLSKVLGVGVDLEHWLETKLEAVVATAAPKQPAPPAPPPSP